MNINIVTIGGNLTRDPELKHFESGSAFCDFGIANNRKYKTKDGDVKEEVSFIGLVAYGKVAENIAKYFVKGSPILIEGRIKTDQWEEEGKKRSKTKVIVNRFHFCGGKKVEEKPQESKEEVSWDEEEQVVKPLDNPN